MSNPHKIILIGFSAFERATFESFFRLAARRPPGYALVTEASQADLAVVNADDSTVLKQCIAAKPCKQVMLIGNQDGGTGWAVQKRPLNLMKVLASVEAMLAAGAPVAPAASAAPVRASSSSNGGLLSAQSGIFASPQAMAASQPSTLMPKADTHSTRPAFAPLSTPAAQDPSHLRPSTPVQTSQTSGISGPSAAVSLSDRAQRSVRSGSGRASESEFMNSRNDALGGLTRPASTAGELDMDVDHILVVDDSDIALKFMRNRLTRFGFSTDLVNSGEEALGRLNDKPYKFIFLDVMMEGLDGYQTCRAIKQRKYPEGKPPVVVMLTSRGGTIDKIRGTLAGCDAYLTKPLNERDLIAVLAKHDRNVARGFQETSMGVGGRSDFGQSTRV